METVNVSLDGVLHKMGIDYYPESIVPGFDLGWQMGAIVELLQRHREIVKIRDENIDEANKGEMYDEVMFSVQNSIYQDATYSVASIALIAPLVETLFRRSFLHMRDTFFKNGEPPSQKRSTDQTKAWDCKFCFSKDEGWKEDVFSGSKQLVTETGLKTDFPDEFWHHLEALFAYRNKSLHEGMIWTEESREKFLKHSQLKKWDEKWFSSAKTNHKPWVFYLEPIFIDYWIEKGIGVITKAFWDFHGREMSKTAPKHIKDAAKGTGK